jgi:hypothetical protein
MTWLWTLLIVLGVALIVVAIWPSVVRPGRANRTEPESPRSEDA